jgi:hypothetical protein
MKMKVEHFEYLQSEIEKALVKYPNVIHEYETGQFPRSEKVKDLQTRFNNDMKFGAGLNRFICDTLYPYLDDTHINTALNKICPKVERKF